MKRSILVLLLVLPLACETKRVMYRKTPSFYSRMADMQGGRDTVLDDGTELRFIHQEPRELDNFTDHTGKTFLMREEQPDGSISLNAIMPEHVLLLLLDCVQEQEYTLFWDEMISTETKEWYESEGGGQEACLEFLRINRRDIADTLTRMKMGMGLNEVERIQAEDEIIRLRIVKHLRHRFTFTELDTRWEDGKFVLVSIR
ncbi:MAG: hypothetical protein CMJ36_05310 [Phycisphaerae bacterium]|nr:hypothetical protein [Phycisphaerae bacterium]